MGLLINNKLLNWHLSEPTFFSAKPSTFPLAHCSLSAVWWPPWLSHPFLVKESKISEKRLIQAWALNRTEQTVLSVKSHFRDVYLDSSSRTQPDSYRLKPHRSEKWLYLNVKSHFHSVYSFMNQAQEHSWTYTGSNTDQRRDCTLMRDLRPWCVPWLQLKNKCLQLVNPGISGALFFIACSFLFPTQMGIL